MKGKKVQYMLIFKNPLGYNSIAPVVISLGKSLDNRGLSVNYSHNYEHQGSGTLSLDEKLGKEDFKLIMCSPNVLEIKIIK